MTSGHKIVHRLGCGAWHGPAPSPHKQCRHLNASKLDNRPSNLIWGTKNQNFRDRVKHEGFKLTPRLVRQIRSEMIAGLIYAALAKKYQVSYHTVYYRGEALTWKRQGYGITTEFREWQRVYRKSAI